MSAHHVTAAENYRTLCALKDGDSFTMQVFHASPAVFDEFKPSSRRNSPGIWFGIDENYVRAMGNHVYACEIDCKRVKVDWDDLTVEEMLENGLDTQLMLFKPDNDGIEDAFVVVADLDCIRILERRDYNDAHDDKATVVSYQAEALAI